LGNCQMFLTLQAARFPTTIFLRYPKIALNGFTFLVNCIEPVEQLGRFNNYEIRAPVLEANQHKHPIICF